MFDLQKHEVIKPSRIYNLSRRFNGLSNETRINSICHHFNIKKIVILHLFV